LTAECDNLLVYLGLFDPPYAQLFFQHKLPLNSKNLLYDGNDGDIALLSYRGHRFDWTVCVDAFHLDSLAFENLFNQLYAAVRYTRHLHPCSFDTALANRNLLFEKRDDRLATRAMRIFSLRIRRSRGRWNPRVTSETAISGPAIAAIATI
jgi:hypothetical protein